MENLPKRSSEAEKRLIKARAMTNSKFRTPGAGHYDLKTKEIPGGRMSNMAPRNASQTATSSYPGPQDYNPSPTSKFGHKKHKIGEKHYQNDHSLNLTKHFEKMEQKSQMGKSRI